MESLAFATSLAVTPSSSRKVNPRPKFCAQGCVKCSPVSLSLRSSSLSSSKRSECSSSSTGQSESQFYGDQLKAAEKARFNRQVLMRSVRVVFVDECGSENLRDTDALITNLEEPKRLNKGHAVSLQTPRLEGRATPLQTPNLEDVSALGFNGSPSNGATASSVVANPATEQQRSDIDEIWLTIKAEARRESEMEPALASYFYSSVISHRYIILTHPIFFTCECMGF